MSESPTMAYTEAFRDGMRAARDDHFTSCRISREQADAIIRALPNGEGDGYLAGYYAEMRKLRNDQETEALEAAARGKNVHPFRHSPRG